MQVKIDYHYKYPRQAKILGYEINTYLSRVLNSIQPFYLVQSGSFGCVVKGDIRNFRAILVSRNFKTGSKISQKSVPLNPI